MNLNYLDPNPVGAPAVLLLHGLGATGESWTLQMPRLIEAGLRPIAPDIPGFGKSPYDGRGWSIHRMAGRMAQLLEDLCTGPAVVVGLSMGGTIAQQVCLDYPGLVQKLVLVSTFDVLRPESFSAWFYFLRRFFVVMTVGLPAQAEFVAHRIFPAREDETLRQLLIESILQGDPRAYRAAMRSLGLFNSSRRLKEINIPSLVITGSRDTTVSPSRQRHVAEAIPGAKQVLIEGAGHAVSVDQPESFNDALMHFLTVNDTK